MISLLLTLAVTYALEVETEVGGGKRSCASNEVKLWYTGYGAECFKSGTARSVQSTGRDVSTITVPQGCSLQMYTMPNALGSNQKLEGGQRRAGKTFAREIQGKYKKAGGIKSLVVKCGRYTAEEVQVGMVKFPDDRQGWCVGETHRESLGGSNTKYYSKDSCKWACADRRWNGQTPTGCEFSANYHTCNAFWGGSVLASLRGTSYRCMLVAKAEKAVGGFHTDRACQGHSECTEHSMGSCDNRNGKCHYGYWYKGEAEKAVGGFHTDRACQGHSECTEHSMGSCDNRNGKCHYGYWYKGEAESEAKVGLNCGRGSYRDCDDRGCWCMSEAEVGCPGGMIPDPRGGCMHAEVATSDPMYWWNMAFAAPSSSFTAENFVIYGFSIIGFGAVVYGAAQHFLKKSSGDAVYEEV